MMIWLSYGGQVHTCNPTRETHSDVQKRKKKTTPFGVNIMRSQVLYWAAQDSDVHLECM